MDFFNNDKLTAIEAKEKAQWIAFSPMVFQASRILKNSGVLSAIAGSKEKGLSLKDIEKQISLPHYGVRVLLEAGLGIGLLLLKEDKYFLTKTAFFILNDTLTAVNLDFTNDVCYQALFYLDESIRKQQPEGLKVLGNWPTVYEGLSQLPEQIRKSWFAFDHYYSDIAFPEALPLVFTGQPKKILDIGGNTGKWAIACANHNKDVQLTIMDLPGQTDMAKKNVSIHGFEDRIDFYKANILDENTVFPGLFDAVWMSQFLDCFSDRQVVSILRRCKQSLTSNGTVFILDTFWDRQRFETAAFCLQMTSLYFTAVANGKSQMYDSKVFFKLVEEAGYVITRITDNIGAGHTLLECRVAENKN